MSTEKVELGGGLGQYTYWAYPINTTFKDEPGNFIYARRSPGGKWQAVYIGQTSSLSQRLASISAEETAIRSGATHILAHLNPDENARKREEADLNNTLVPPFVNATSRRR